MYSFTTMILRNTWHKYMDFCDKKKERRWISVVHYMNIDMITQEFFTDNLQIRLVDFFRFFLLLTSCNHLDRLGRC